MYSIARGNLFPTNLGGYPKGQFLNPIRQGYSIGPIVTNGLIFLLDANNSLGGQNAQYLYDLSGFSSSITQNGQPSFLGNPNRINISSVNNFLRISNLYGQFPILTSQFTIETWIRITADQGGTTCGIFFSAGSNDGNCYGLFYRNTGFVAYIGPGAGTQVVNILRPLNTWCHVVAVRNRANQLICYVNGLASNPTTQAASLIASNPIIGVNPSSLGERMIGDISILKIYNIGLTPEEVLRNYSLGRTFYGV